MKSCLVIESDFLFFLESEKVLKKLGYSKIKNCKNLVELTSSLDNETFDIIISDMILEGGEITWDYFKNNPTDTPIIFTTQLLNEMLFEEIQAHKRFLYLVKPVNQLTLESAIMTIESMREFMHESPNLKGVDIEQLNDTIFVRSKGKIFKISPKEILFVRSDGNYCIIHTTNKKFVVRSSIRNMIDLINDSRFTQVQRAYLVNTSHIENVIINKNKINLKEHSIPIGRKYKKSLIDFLTPEV